MSYRSLIELVSEGAEFGLDQVIDSSLLKEIPVVGWVAKLYDTSNSIRDRLYYGKIKNFLSALNEVSESKRTELRDSIISQQENIEQLTQKILLIIESQKDLEKSEIIANLFLAYLDGKISYLDFNRALDVTTTCFITDLYNFVHVTKDAGFMRESYESLERYGISNLIYSSLIIVDQSTRDELRTDGHEVDRIAPVLYQMSSFGHEYKSAFLYGHNLRSSKLPNVVKRN